MRQPYLFPHAIGFHQTKKAEPSHHVSRWPRINLCSKVRDFNNVHFSNSMGLRTFFLDHILYQDSCPQDPSFLNKLKIHAPDIKEVPLIHYVPPSLPIGSETPAPHGPAPLPVAKATDNYVPNRFCCIRDYPT